MRRGGRGRGGGEGGGRDEEGGWKNKINMKKRAY